MNLQSKSKRWLAAATLTKEITGNTLKTEKRLRDAGRPMPEQAHRVFTEAALYELRLTTEADPVSPDEPLYEVLGDVVQALNGLKVGPEFRASLEILDCALEAAVTSLRDWTGDDDSKIEEIIGDWNATFLISLITD